MSRKTKVKIFIMALISAHVALIAVWIGTETFHHTQNQPQTLPPLSTELKPSDDRIVDVITTALWNDTAEHYKVEIRTEDNENFRQHLRNIGAQRGWFTHESDQSAIKIVVPEHELHQLAEIQADPTGWIKKNTNPGAPSIGPSGPDLVNVRIAIHNQRASFFFLRVTGVTALVLVVAILWPLLHLIDGLKGHDERDHEEGRIAPGSAQSDNLNEETKGEMTTKTSSE